MADNYLHEEIFSKEMINSMKSQMVPSDDVINALLTTISSETSNNIGTSEVRKRRTKKNNFSFRTASKYIAAVAAALVMIIGTISLFGNGDGKQIKGVIDSVIDNPSVVTVPNEDEEIKTPEDDNAVVAPDSDDKQATEKGTKKDTKSNEVKDKPQANENTAKATEPKEQPENIKDNKDNKDSNVTDNKNEPSEDPNWVKEVLAVEAPQAVLMGESYVVSDATPLVSGSDAGSLVFYSSSEGTEKEDAAYKVKAKKIKKVSPNIMVGVKIPDTGETLVYVNRDYAPSTLGEFLKDTGISGNIDFATVIYTAKGDKTRSASSYSIGSSAARGVMSELVFSQAYADTIGSAYNNREETFATLISSRYQNPLGLDIKFEINQNGYLYINISSGNSFTFYIGEDQTDELLETMKPSF